MTASSESSNTSGWCVRLVDGATAWSSWPLTSSRLGVGRGLGCQIRIDNPAVSRFQCELWLESDLPRYRNRSSRQPACVNGTPCEETALGLGDLIEFCGYRLIVDCLAQLEDKQYPKRDTPTRSFEETPYHRGNRHSTNSSVPQLDELFALYHFERELGRATSMDTLVESVRTHLKVRLKAKGVWLAWPVRSEDAAVTLHPAQSPEETLAAPVELLREVVHTGRGLAHEHGGMYLIAAPFAQACHTFGVLWATGAHSFNESALDYLLAVAESTAPHLLAIERLEQHRRDRDAVAPILEVDSPLLGSSRPMKELREQLHRAAMARGHVLLLGETGTGKELASRMIHDLSARVEGPYVAVNCAAIPADLFEAEMFGHEKGAFTGAIQRRKGLFEQAHGGTLFLDEVGDLSAPSQARLLRAADTGAIRPVGAQGELQVDVRIISATNRALPDSENARFRTDLYHRLAQVVVHLPPLRERRGDIPLLANHFLALCSPHSRMHPVAFTAQALEQMYSYDWPGNVRELRNVVERACFVANSNIIDKIEPLTHTTPRPLNSQGASAPLRPPPEAISLEELERRHIQSLLDAHNGDVAATAHALGIPKSTLYYKLSKCGLKARRERKG